MQLRISLKDYKGEIGSVRNFEDIKELDENAKSIIDWIKLKFSKEDLTTRIIKKISYFYENSLAPSFIFMNFKDYDKIRELGFGQVRIYGLPVLPVPDLKEDFIIGFSEND